jgi:hypothetical protein
MKPRLLLLVLLVATGASAYAGQVYSWTDANGTKHFSDSPPPPSINAQKIKVRGSLTTDQGTLAATEPAPAAEPKPPEPAPPGATASAKPLVDSPENRAKQCSLAKSNLALLQSQFQVSAPPGDDGKTAVLDDSGRKQALDKASDQVSFYCK